MSKVEKVSIAFTSQQAEVLREAVDSGEYASASEVVREAMRVWQDRREFRKSEINALRSLWDQGKTSGSPQPVDFSDMREEASRRLKDATSRGG